MHLFSLATTGWLWQVCPKPESSAKTGFQDIRR